jgi:hypothetical protein
VLTQMVQTYTAQPDRLLDLADALIEYENRIALAGYIGRHRRGMYTDILTQRAMLTATLQHPSAAEDMLDSDIPEVAAQFAVVKSLTLAGPLIEKYDAGNTRDEQYCGHMRRKELVLICDPIQGHSALRCNECGGIVGTYKPGLGHQTRQELFGWESQYDRIYSLWLLSAEYATWAEHELSSIDSPISRMGLQLARRIGAELDMRVCYYLHLKEEGLDRHCPGCGNGLHEAIGTIWNLSCQACSLVVGRG